MKVIKVEPLGFAANSFIITADNRSAIVVDPSQKRILDILEKHNLKCEYVLLTHGHFDHVGGADILSKQGAKVICSERERSLIFSESYLSLFGGVQVPHFEVDKTVKDGEILRLCNLNVKVIETSGHSIGSVSYLIDDCIFSGDTLFRGSVGRCDLPTGNMGELVRSVKKLYSLKGDFKVYCGHDLDTTLDYERKNNMYVRESNVEN